MIFDRLWRPPSDAHVIPLRPDHARAMAALHAEAFARPWSAADLEAMTIDPMIVGDGLFLGRDRQPSGFALSRAVLDEAEILTVVIARRHHGKGFGKTLLAAHLGRVMARGVTDIFLEVEEGNRPAIALYEAFDFLHTGRRESYYVKTDGRRVAAQLMRRSSS
ncbi:Ribosomal-protein-S18p-alanine acetyltransferase [Hyphomicrobiales bacterium]|nr:Ribosomal-protein-S18p-alanine acetyltransferase [Hyphomicrobiales bacterium]CAH1680153.1 Ribosomal-protein-S18p-alanine acetyltransferase [Hyphomicrobiales bacterium]